MAGIILAKLVLLPKADREALKAGTRDWNFLGKTFQVMNKETIPYKYVEDWKRPKCYWGKQT